MKKILIIIIITLLSLFVSCKKVNREVRLKQKEKLKEIYSYVELDGCSYVFYKDTKEGYLAKADCNCVPKSLQK